MPPCIVFHWIFVRCLPVADPGFVKREGRECKCHDAARARPEKSLSGGGGTLTLFSWTFIWNIYIMGWGHHLNTGMYLCGTISPEKADKGGGVCTANSAPPPLDPECLSPLNSQHICTTTKELLTWTWMATVYTSWDGGTIRLPERPLWWQDNKKSWKGGGGGGHGWFSPPPPLDPSLPPTPTLAHTSTTATHFWYV